MANTPLRYTRLSFDPPLWRKIEDASKRTGLTYTDVVRAFVSQGDSAALLDATPDVMAHLLRMRDHLREVERLMPQGSYLLTTLNDHLHVLIRMAEEDGV